MNLPAGVTWLPGERGRDRTVGRCWLCSVELEFDDDLNVWRFDGEYGRVAEIVEHLGRMYCSQRCFSQQVYNTAPARVQELLCTLARAANALQESICIKSERWCLETSHITHLLPRTYLVAAETEAQELLTRMGVDDDAPDWFLEAIGEPRKKPAASAVATDGAA